MNKDLTWFEQNGRRIHYKIKEKIIRHIRKGEYNLLGYYLFEEIFKDDSIQNRRDIYIGKTPQKTVKILENNIPRELPEEIIINKIEAFIAHMRFEIFHNRLEP